MRPRRKRRAPYRLAYTLTLGVYHRVVRLMWSFLEPSYPYRRAVIVNLKTGRAFRGVLWQRTAGFLVLKSAELLKERQAPVPVDGEVLVPFDDVEFIQLVAQVKAV